MIKWLLIAFLYLNLMLLVDAKFFKRIEHVDKVIKVYGYKDSAQKKNDIVCQLSYNPSYLTTGWDILMVETFSGSETDQNQARCAGELEGLITTNATYVHYYNNVKQWCKGRKRTCAMVFKFLKIHLKWIAKKIKEKSNTDPFWYHVDIIYNHFKGLHDGYTEGMDPKKSLSLEDFIVMNFIDDLDDVSAAVTGDISAKVRGDTRCSAIIKLLPNNQDILIGHNTWTSYTQMYRMLKRYKMAFRIGPHSQQIVPGSDISFSGYPGQITSGDDFYVANNNLVALETTIGNSNDSLWKYVKPTGQVFEAVRSLVALRLASNGSSWCQIFSGYNSGTYNNQWMIVDLNKFTPGKSVQEGTLWILEQIPGYIRYEDKTSVFQSQTYWPSYNVPYYKDIFNMSGNQELVDKYGDWFSYNKTARALIFHRDHKSVIDLNSLMTLLRSNNYTQDPYSHCNCTPPYSAENAIAARSDLNPKNGKYPFPALGHRPHGAIDAKVVSSSLARNMTFIAVCGPTVGAGLPPFHWNTSTYKHLPHMGQPNSFEGFRPMWPEW